MSAVLQHIDQMSEPMQFDMMGVRPFHKAPKVCRALMDGASKSQEATVTQPECFEPQAAAIAARLIAEAQQAMMERISMTPVVPLAWIRGSMQVTPEEVGERKAGRPKINITRKLAVADLENWVVLVQRRTREITKVIKDTQSSSDHTAVLIKGVIKDAIRKLSLNLPEKTRDELDSVVSKI